MLTEIRWLKEQELMRSVFPEFQPFARGSRFGFEGHLKGPRSGTLYSVSLQGERQFYPQWPPAVHMQPRIGIHWIGEGDGRRLCVEREWRPATSTFANTLLTLVRYLDEYDRAEAALAPGQSAGGDPPGCEGATTPVGDGARRVWWHNWFSRGLF